MGLDQYIASGYNEFVGWAILLDEVVVRATLLS
jgi:hypothetical protein